MARDLMALYGKNSVFERLKADPTSIIKIFLQDSFNAVHIKKLIRQKNIPVEYVFPKELARIRHTKDLQGIVARVYGFEYAPFDELLNQPKERQFTFVFLDRINDPHNLGVIIRTLACLGGFAVVIPKFEACEVNETVLHVASGGENYVPVSRVSNLSNAILKAKERGYWIMGAVVEEGAQEINETSLPFPLGLVLGSEGSGIRHGLERHLDLKVRIPTQGAKLSLNVNIACAILCHEVCKKRIKQ